MEVVPPKHGLGATDGLKHAALEKQGHRAHLAWQESFVLVATTMPPAARSVRKESTNLTLDKEAAFHVFLVSTIIKRIKQSASLAAETSTPTSQGNHRARAARTVKNQIQAVPSAQHATRGKLALELMVRVNHVQNNIIEVERIQTARSASSVSWEKKQLLLDPLRVRNVKLGSMEVSMARARCAQMINSKTARVSQSAKNVSPPNRIRMKSAQRAKSQTGPLPPTAKQICSILMTRWPIQVNGSAPAVRLAQTALAIRNLALLVGGSK